MSAGRSRAGFTLIEVLAAVGLTAVTIAVAVGFMVQITDSTSRATAFTRDGRRAAGVLDRVARDLAGAFLLQKPSDRDPLEHPWLFLGEPHLSDTGSDRLKFVTRSYRSHRDDGRAGDLAVVSYVLVPGADRDFDLLRFATPGLPDGLDRSFPDALDAESGGRGAAVLAEGIAIFHARFLNAEAEWVDSWDSSTLAASGELPLAVEIEVAMASDAEPGPAADAAATPTAYLRRVVLPVRPLDLALLIRSGGVPGAGGEGDEAEQEDEEAEDDGSRGDSGNTPPADDSAALPDRRLQACMDVHRGELIPLVGQAFFNRYYNAPAGGSDVQFAWSLVQQYGLSCP